MSEETVPRVGQKGSVFTTTVEEPNPNYDPSLPISPTNKKYLIVDLNQAVGEANKIEFKRPNKSTFTRNAVVFGTPSDGKLQYINLPSEASVFDMAGLWRLRGIAKFSDGSEFPGSWTEMRVGL